MKNCTSYLSLLSLGAIMILTSGCKKDEITTISDIDGNIYHSVKIENQIWMVENLKTTRFTDGTTIPLVEGDSAWWKLTTPGICWYNNDEKNRNIYGALYNWYSLSTGKLCPSGWHVPSDNEWTVLTNYLGGESMAGGKLKEIGTVHWINNTGATDESGFKALPGGFRETDPDNPSSPVAVFWNIGTAGYWWSSTVDNTYYAWFRQIYSHLTEVSKSSWSLRSGFSVRCLKD